MLFTLMATQLRVILKSTPQMEQWQKKCLPDRVFTVSALPSSKTSTLVWHVFIWLVRRVVFPNFLSQCLQGNTIFLGLICFFLDFFTSTSELFLIFISSCLSHQDLCPLVYSHSLLILYIYNTKIILYLTWFLGVYACT